MRAERIAPVSVYPFHASYPGMPDLFHVSCDMHDIGFCGERPAAERFATQHTTDSHQDAPDA